MDLMPKDFDKWSRNKKLLEEHAYAQLSFHEREIWWCSLGLNLGDEQDGKHQDFERPVLVLRFLRKVSSAQFDVIRARLRNLL